MAALQTHSEEFRASISDLTGLLSLEEGIDRALQRVTEMASKIIPGVDGVGITLVLRGTLGAKPVMRTAAYSDPWVKTVDLDQYRTGEGPCMDAIIKSEVTHLRDLTDPRYAEFCALAFEEGLGSVLAVPLDVDGSAVGALNLYSRATGAFDESAQDIAVSFATQAAIALINIELYDGARALSRQLGDAMDSRAVIEQAKGMVMGRDGCTADEAFGKLKLISQESNTKLHEVAQALVTNGVGTN
jgi:GAF domain-containing protein